MSTKQVLTGDYRQYMDKDYIGEWDLPENDDLIVEIDHVEVNQVKSERGSDNKLCVHFKGGYKPLIINATNGAAITEALGTGKVERWAYKKIALYRERVSAFGKTVMAVRVRPFAPKQDEYFCDECGCQIMDEGKYSARAIAQSSQSKFGRSLCMSCAKQIKEEIEAESKKGDVLSDENNEG